MAWCCCTFHRTNRHELSAPLKVDERGCLTVEHAKAQGVAEGETIYRRNVGTAGGTYLKVENGKFVNVGEVAVCGDFDQEQLNAAARAEGLTPPWATTSKS